MVVIVSSFSSFKAAEIVSNLWVEDCLDQGKEIRPEGWHRPVDVDRGARPCEGVVIGVTNYVGREREYITYLGRDSLLSDFSIEIRHLFATISA